MTAIIGQANLPRPVTDPDAVHKGDAAEDRERRVDTQYEDLLADVLEHGTEKSDRTGTGTRSIFGRQLRYRLNDGFPLITTKAVHFRSVAYELLWFLRGDSNVRWLHEHGVSIWDEWAGPDGDLGPVYGAQWRSWPTPDGRHVDQIADVLDEIRANPDSRRMIVSAWNVADLDKMALPPCHLLFQLYVGDGALSCQVYQRSADLFLGVPFNLASYALLTHILADQAGLDVGDLIWTGGDCHIYNNHRTQVDTQLARAGYPFPTLHLAHADRVEDYTLEHITLDGYRHHDRISAPVAV